MPPRLRTFLHAIAFWTAGVAPVLAQSLGDLLKPEVELGNPSVRAEVVTRVEAHEQARLATARQKAIARGLPIRVLRPNGALMELADFDGEQPVYRITHNLNAAISTGANLLQAAPYSLTGAGTTVGVWDGGSGRPTHQEFGGRVVAKDGGTPLDHSAHVTGTIAAAGLQAAAKGMAPSVAVDSYEWTSDRSEMTARAASYPGEAGKIYLSNHSYGFVAGWNATGKASPVWDWWGNGTTSTATDQDFGKYDTNARDSDSLAVGAPYYLMIRSAGNDRGDNPSAGQAVSLSAGGSNAVSYDPALHPPGDASYKNGYDTISFDATGKNVLTIGSVSDAVSGGVRDATVASLSWFSSCGPTDDGRIKPDLVANGENVYSTWAASDVSYATISGTSMASPNATGSAALLVSYFDQLFPGQAMRSSTVKALLIQTANDLGTPGPDYRYGWGLVNVKAAADLLNAYHANPGGAQVVEGRVTTASTIRTHPFTWDGASPIRATLVWTDPAGTATTSADSRTPRLVNNLDLKIIAPNAVEFSPYIMPFVGVWTTATLSSAATTGKNNTDNVEQVFISSPSLPGQYQAAVTVDGVLTNGVQNYSLIISGGATAVLPPPAATSVTPASGNSGVVALSVTGANLLVGATVKLARTGQPDIAATSVEPQGDLVKFRINLNGRAPGLWNVVITNPDGQSVTLANAFSIIGSIWQDDFESGAAGWTHGVSQGTVDVWALSAAQSRSATHSYFASGPASTNINDLNSPSVAVPAAATNLNLSFWHNFNFQNGRDGGVLELSVDGGAWLDVTDASSGASFGTGGYNGAFATSGSPATRNPLAPRSAWTNANTGFTQVVVNLTNTAKFAGHSVRFRWRLATNNSTTSAGWYLDDVTLNGGGVAVNLAPTITTDAMAASSPVTGTSTILSVQASDDGGEGALKYAWSYTGGTFETPVSFSENGTNAAKTTTATFTGAGNYTFTATVRDAEGLVATSSVDLSVNQTPSTVSVFPGDVSLGKGDSQGFTSTLLDQFNMAFSVQPSVNWSTDGGGVIGADGVFNALAVGGPFHVSATFGSASGSALVTVTGETLNHWKSAHFTAEQIAAGLSDDLADPDGDGIGNKMEYSLGMDPLGFSVLPSPVLNPEGHLTLTLQRPKALPGVNYIGEAGGEVSTWDTNVPIEIVVEGDPQTIRVTDPVGILDAPHRFLRLKTTSP